MACYNTPACLISQSPACQPETQFMVNKTDFCLKGNTFKFSITPEFGFYNGTVQCHMRRARTGSWTRLDYVLDFMNTVVGAKRWAYGASVPEWTIAHSTQINGDSRTSITLAEGLHMDVEHSSFLNGINRTESHASGEEKHSTDEDRMQEAILVATYQNKSNSYDYVIYPLKSLERGEYGSPSEHRPLIDRPIHSDNAFTTVQTVRPHIYNTATWRRAGCDLNISHFVRPQRIYRSNEGRSIDLLPLQHSFVSRSGKLIPAGLERERDMSKPYRFALHEKNVDWPRVTMRMFGNRSLIRESFCGKPGLARHRLVLLKQDDARSGKSVLQPVFKAKLHAEHLTGRERKFILQITGPVRSGSESPVIKLGPGDLTEFPSAAILCSAP
ncbi:unnamed protein product [Echinostoma caproni]|uniref:Uncharacterized protein n=1 Tax=Echinostoma caproni TaxID=27848 RepID=A0A3P8ET18_9TREM|nr:unnamed protein product [Echinostoma caproni]